MLKFLKGVVAGSGTGVKDLPYNIGEPYSSAWGSWTHHRGTSKDDGSPVSIFSLSGSNAQDGHLAAGRNGVKRLRTVRHPNILSFLYSTEVETFDGSATKVTIYIVTEPVMPLSEKIKELGLDGKRRFMLMYPYLVWLLPQHWTGSCMLLMFYLSLMGAMKLLVGQCCNMHGLLVLNTNQGSW